MGRRLGQVVKGPEGPRWEKSKRRMGRSGRGDLEGRRVARSDVRRRGGTQVLRRR